MRLLVSLLALLAVATPSSLTAQVGGSTDIIMGRVIGPDSQPVAGARVMIVAVGTNATKNTLTRPDGRFTVLFRDGGGQYRLLVTFLGLRPANLTVQRQADEDRLVVTVHMSANPQQLSTVQVRGRGNAAPAQASAAGGSERVLPPQLLERLPTNPGDLEATATLVPGVVAISGSDSTRPSFSVAAQPASQNNITVDGMSFLFGSVPQDAVRATRVVLNAYDVSRGQFTGGQIATTTKAGTSQFQGTANFTGRLPQTQFAGSTADAFANKYSQGLLSSGVGGPFRKKKEGSYYFVSGQVERRSDDALSLATAGSGTLERMGVSPDSVARFTALMPAPGNLAFVRPGFSAPLDRVTTSGSVLARTDFDVGDVHQLMLRGDWRTSSSEGGRTAPLASPSTGGTTDASGGGAMAMLTSVTGPFINEARVYASREDQSSDPYVLAPAGAVTVSSLVDGKQQVATLQFGGSQFLPRSSATTLAEASNELSWLTENGGHRLKLGALLNRERARATTATNLQGVFVYNSLADLEANRPAMYARSFAGNGRSGGSDNVALYLGDAWRFSPSLQLTYGVRGEASRIVASSVIDANAARDLGRKAGELPRDYALSPRFGVTYLIGNVAGVPSGTFRAGIGEFRGRIPSTLVSYVAGNNGTLQGQGQLVCVGPATPIPDWRGYFDTVNPSYSPTDCLGGGPAPTFGSAAPNVASFTNDFGAPKVWRASAALGKRVFTRYGLGVDAMYAYGVNNPVATDANLTLDPVFTSSDGRPVFAPVANVVPSTGAVSLSSSRILSQYGTVFDIGSGLRSRTAQVTLQLTGGGNSIRSATVGFFSLGYTFMRATDEANGYPFANAFPTTAGDPRVREWGTSDLERRHNVVGSALFVFPRAIELSVIAHVLSGPRYTPMVNGDVNADGVRNDRAYVRSLDTPPTMTNAFDTALFNGMQRVLNATDSRARECLLAQQGRIAARNSCSTPWVPGVDLQLNWRPARFGFDRRVTMSLVAVNTFAGVDELVHGPSHMRGWGQPVFPDRLLLNVRGFDPASRTYRYTVNEHFGSPSGASNPFRLPFQLGLQVHTQLGVDPQREALKSIFGTSNGKPPSITELKERIYKNFPLPIKMALESADSLKLNLTADQLTRLRAINDSVNQRADTLVGMIAEVLSKAGSNPDPGSIAPKLQRTQTEALAIIQRSVTLLKANLTAEQWALLPDKIKFPLQQPAAARQSPPRP